MTAQDNGFCTLKVLCCILFPIPGICLLFYTPQEPLKHSGKPSLRKPNPSEDDTTSPNSSGQSMPAEDPIHIYQEDPPKKRTLRKPLPEAEDKKNCTPPPPFSNSLRVSPPIPSNDPNIPEEDPVPKKKRTLRQPQTVEVEQKSPSTQKKSLREPKPSEIENKRPSAQMSLREPKPSPPPKDAKTSPPPKRSLRKPAENDDHTPLQKKSLRQPSGIIVR